MSEADFDNEVRRVVYDVSMQFGFPPKAVEVAHALGSPLPNVYESYRKLAAARVLVLQPVSGEILMASPFSAVPTAFEVEVGPLRCYANCIWDALGIPAMLKKDAVIRTACGCCSDSMEIIVAGGSLKRSEGIIHFAVPAAKWWTNIVFT